MSATSVAMMVVAMLIIWGGLILAILNLSRSPELPAVDEVHRDL